MTHPSRQYTSTITKNSVLNQTLSFFIADTLSSLVIATTEISLLLETGLSCMISSLLTEATETLELLLDNLQNMTHLNSIFYDLPVLIPTKSRSLKSFSLKNEYKGQWTKIHGFQVKLEI